MSGIYAIRRNSAAGYGFPLLATMLISRLLHDRGLRARWSCPRLVERGDFCPGWKELEGLAGFVPNFSGNPYIRSDEHALLYHHLLGCGGITRSIFFRLPPRGEASAEAFLIRKSFVMNTLHA